jgi:hypothetical protein
MLSAAYNCKLAKWQEWLYEKKSRVREGRVMLRIWSLQAVTALFTLLAATIVVSFPSEAQSCRQVLTQSGWQTVCG